MITLTFKSGSLWHGEYQVVNPEVIPITPDGYSTRIKDGDQITLPEGYGIKYTLSGRIEFKEVGHSEATTKTATIITPEKPENSAHGDCKECTSYFGYPMSKCFHCKPKVSEPSESQEEMWKEVVDKISKTVESYVNEFIDSSSEQMRDDLRTDLEELKEKFTITRK